MPDAMHDLPQGMNKGWPPPCCGSTNISPCACKSPPATSSIKSCILFRPTVLASSSYLATVQLSQRDDFFSQSVDHWPKTLTNRILLLVTMEQPARPVRRKTWAPVLDSRWPPAVPLHFAEEASSAGMSYCYTFKDRVKLVPWLQMVDVIGSGTVDVKSGLVRPPAE